MMGPYSLQDINNKRNVMGLALSRSSSTTDSKNSMSSMGSVDGDGSNMDLQLQHSIMNEQSDHDEREDSHHHHDRHGSHHHQQEHSFVSCCLYKLKKNNSLSSQSSTDSHHSMKSSSNKKRNVRLLNNGHRISKLNPEYYNDYNMNNNNNMNNNMNNNVDSQGHGGGKLIMDSLYNTAMKNRFSSTRNPFMNFDSY